MVIKTDYDIWQEVYRAVWDFNDSGKAYTPVHKFIIDKITITKRGVHYHLVDVDGNCLYQGGWLFASPICLTFDEAQEYARTSQETTKTYPR